ncbi:MAG: histidine kinase [Saprospiraceae bacterium]|nr:histidine kinase [Saprospiraceae bacterium]
MKKTRSLLDRTYEVLSRRPIYHGLFWLVLFSLMRWIDQGNEVETWFALGNELIQLFFYVVLVYLNLLYLIPNYLARHAFVYFGLVLAVCAIVTPIEVLVLFLKFSNQDAYRESLVQNQVWIFWGNLVVTIISTILRVIMDWWRYQNEKQVLLTQTIQSELRFLKSQINPHFLFNTLNNLYALTLKKSDKAPEIVLKLSEIMRYMLYECNERRVPLSREIQYIYNYLDLERLRQPKDADIRFIVEGNISNQIVAPLLFVPFLENSFKHGLNHMVTGAGFVRLSLLVSDEDLEFSIENSKVDQIPKENHARSGGIGLVNVRQRLNILYPENHTLEITDEPNRYVVTLRLKLDH